MDSMYGIIAIVSLILVAGQVQAQGQSCGGSDRHHCVARHMCKNQLDFRMAMSYRNLGCVSTAICCPKNRTIQKPVVIINEPIADPHCGFVNSKGVTFSFSEDDTGLAQEGEVPWMVALLDARTRSYVAGGALIAPHVVITARQRTENMNANQLVVRAGEWDFKTATEQFPHVDVPIRSIVRHPGFSLETGGNNVALVFLRRSLTSSRHINSICMPSAPKNYDFTRCIFTGWGKNSFDDSSYMNVMKKVSLPVVPSRTCEQQLRPYYGNDFKLDNSLMCAGGEPGKDSCAGDGGSPLACPMKDNPNRYELAGIVNFGVSCGLPGVPAVYTSVANVIGWIVMETNEGPIPEEREGVPYASPALSAGPHLQQWNQPNYGGHPTSYPNVDSMPWQVLEADSDLASSPYVSYHPVEDSGINISSADHGNEQQIIKPIQEDKPNEPDDFFNSVFSTTMEYNFD
ncbi:phenoloxidase-activating factor 2-like [Drosophila mauritiana]|uniref:Phenoloxidase-activating factor 2-like n=1 Tax=Drosophila mauritiana TaxID=7226 RepID=A0A6P8KW73_DROMA|nr:phenoloxidase-activating factor 2-like [Drosophila mauritiana]